MMMMFFKQNNAKLVLTSLMFHVSFSSISLISHSSFLIHIHTISSPKGMGYILI